VRGGRLGLLDVFVGGGEDAGFGDMGLRGGGFIVDVNSEEDLAAAGEVLRLRILASFSASSLVR